MSAFIVVYDACVLYPAPLRDLLMRVATKGLVQAKWTDEIHEEWIRNLLEDRPDLTEEQLRRTQSLMNRAVPDCLVTGYEALVPALELPDPDDRHVLAAAIRAGAQTIVTSNIGHFPKRVLAQYDIEAENPDAFLLGLIDIDVGRVADAATEQLASLRNPAVDRDEFLVTLERNGLVQTVAALRELI